MRNEIGEVSRVKAIQIADSARAYEKETLRLLRQLVEIESPSGSKAAVDQCMACAADACRERGGKVRWHRQKGFGDLLEARFGFRRNGGARPVLLLGHLDTVWPLGTLRRMPYRVEGGRIWGPGVLDMKAGVAMALTTLKILQERGALTRPVILLLNSEEEVGSPVSRPVTEAMARECEAVFVLEPGQGQLGAYKTSRKGTGNFTVRVRGVAAHAGVDFQNGHSAIVELARQIEKIHGFNAPELGLTVNAGVVGGGTQSNVVAEEAWTEVDFRFVKRGDAKKIERKFASLRPINKKCRLEIAGGVNRPPMERTKETRSLFARAKTFAEQLGFELTEASTGGGSDGNFTSAIGVPTLDGMGAVGEGAHANNESIRTEYLAPRAALLAAMIMKM
jgi:glutamate carboxypeptidase